MSKPILFFSGLCLFFLISLPVAGRVVADDACGFNPDGSSINCPNGADAPYEYYTCQKSLGYDALGNPVEFCSETYDHSETGVCLAYEKDGFDYCQINGETGVYQGGCFSWEPIGGVCFYKLDLDIFYGHVGCCPGDNFDPGNIGCTDCEMIDTSEYTCSNRGFTSATRGFIAQVYDEGASQNSPNSTLLQEMWVSPWGVSRPKELIGSCCYGMFGWVTWKMYFNFKLPGTYTFRSTLCETNMIAPSYQVRHYPDGPSGAPVTLYTRLDANDVPYDCDSDGLIGDSDQNQMQGTITINPGEEGEWRYLTASVAGGGWGTGWKSPMEPAPLSTISAPPPILAPCPPAAPRFPSGFTMPAAITPGAFR